MRVTGSGNYVYEVIRPWGELPAGMEFGQVNDVAVDSHDNVYASSGRTLPSSFSTGTAGTSAPGDRVCSWAPTACTSAPTTTSIWQQGR